MLFYAIPIALFFGCGIMGCIKKMCCDQRNNGMDEDYDPPGRPHKSRRGGGSRRYGPLHSRDDQFDRGYESEDYDRGHRDRGRGR